MAGSKESSIGQRKPVSRFQVILMAATAGISVANIYYNQPIFKEISTTFHTTDSKAGFVSMLSQIGYGLGLFFITPLGDKVNKKDLVISLQMLLIASLLFITIAGSIGQLWVLKIYLPDVINPFKGNYLQLLKSALQQVARFPLLRTTSVIGALQFGLFCSFWTTLTFHLSGPPFHYSTDIIGLFGLVAIAGALLAPVLGRKTDNGQTGKIRRIAIGLIIGSISMMMVFPVSVSVLILAVLLLDVGIQAMQVTNVALIYSLDETSHSRINTIFMTSVFTGGALGTLAGILCWQGWGWSGVTGHMLISALLISLIMRKEKTKD